MIRSARMAVVAIGLGLSVAALADEPRQSAVHAMQIDFAALDSKHIIVASQSSLPMGWQVTDAAHRVILQGHTQPYGPDAASGDNVQDADLSDLRKDGHYTFVLSGAEPLTIGVSRAPFARVKYAALNYFYQTRAGIAIAARFAGGSAWARAAGHPHEVAGCFAGKDTQGNVWPGCDYTLDVTGGWYDAGDQGKYVVNGGIALWTLQNLYEQQIHWGDDAFADGRAALPEAGNGLNDLLDESRWEMRFLLAMQIPDGKTAMVPIGLQPRGTSLRLVRIDASGMAHHKVADRAWTPLPTAPADDSQLRLLYPPGTAATLNLAATAAQCARIWRKLDPAFSVRCLNAAERAFAAALRNPAIYTAQGFTGSGGYGDNDLSDEFYWATAELFATTGRPELAAMLRHMDAFRAPLTVPNWGGVAALGTITLAMEPNGLAPSERAVLRAKIIQAADGLMVEAAHSGYRIPHASPDFSWGSNGDLLNRAMILALAERITGMRKYREAVADVANYLLGRNALDQSFVSGIGTKPMVNPHHRFWAHGLDARYPPPPAGVLSGGPNSTFMGDPVAQAMQGHCVGMRCWKDANFAYAMNEVAINWNAPLVWVTAYLDATSGGAKTN